MNEMEIGNLRLFAQPPKWVTRGDGTTTTVDLYGSMLVMVGLWQEVCSSFHQATRRVALPLDLVASPLTSTKLRFQTTLVSLSSA